MVSATDGDVGTVVNFLLDDERWVVRYLVVETGTFFVERRVFISPISFRERSGRHQCSRWFGKKVLLAPYWANRISWDEGKVFIDLSRQEVRSGPEWNVDAPSN